MAAMNTPMMVSATLMPIGTEVIQTNQVAGAIDPNMIKNMRLIRM